MTVHRLDHAGYVVEDLAAAIAFFVELGLELEGQATVEGAWVDQLIGLDEAKADIAMLRTPDGHSRIELSTFDRPVSASPAPWAPVNVPGIPRLTFIVDSVDDVFDRLRPHGAELVGEVAQYEDIYRYGYVRGPAGVIIGLCEELEKGRLGLVRRIRLGAIRARCPVAVPDLPITESATRPRAPESDRLDHRQDSEQPKRRHDPDADDRPP